MGAYYLGRLIGDLVFLGLALTPILVGFRMVRYREPSDVDQPGRLAPAKRKKLGIALIVVGVFLFLLVSAAIRSKPTSSSRSDFAELSVGKCITGTQYATRDLGSGSVACGTTQSMYALVYRGSASSVCPDGKRDETGYAALVTSSTLYCFTFDVAEGECFATDASGKFPIFVWCNDPTARVKIDRIVEGSSDLSACPNGAMGIAYPKPSRVICTVKP